MFENVLNILIIVVIVLTALAIITIALLFGLTFKHEKYYAAQMKDASNSIRIYTVDLENEIVSFFNRSNLRKRNTISLLQFYEHFPSDEREDLIEWINALANDDRDVQKFKEIHVVSKHRKQRFFSFLEVKDVNFEKKIIRLDSYLLKSTNVRKAKKDVATHFSSLDAFNTYLSSASASKGYTVAFDFFNIRNNDQISFLVFAQIKNIFKRYILPNRLIIELSEHQIIVSDFKASNRLQFVQLVNSIKNDINSYLMISSLLEQINYVCSAIENKYMVQQPEKLVDTLVSLIDIAKDDNESIIWYEEGKDMESLHGDETYRTEVERIIRDKKLSYKFRSIIDLDKARIVGYQSSVTPLDSFFGSINELKTYAARTEDDRALFTTIARNIITRYTQEKSNETHRLFLQVNNFERHYVNRTFAHIANIKTIHIVLVYSEAELSNLTDNISTINEIRNFKSRGYQVALELDDNDMALPSALYEVFDYFFVDVDDSIKIGHKSMQRSLLAFRSMVEQLLKYHRPIIAVDIPSWDTVELIYKLGISLVSSDVIAPFTENVLPLPSKSLIKIKNIKK
ncbi:MAG: hypothetical protein K6E11_00835 [Bacilli bacterium]|nr:hypothetical protein [Bacilli bacterium]